jgi:hypothetical protein
VGTGLARDRGSVWEGKGRGAGISGVQSAELLRLCWRGDGVLTVAGVELEDKARLSKLGTSS